MTSLFQPTSPSPPNTRAKKWVPPALHTPHIIDVLWQCLQRVLVPPPLRLLPCTQPILLTWTTATPLPHLPTPPPSFPKFVNKTFPRTLGLSLFLEEKPSPLFSPWRPCWAGARIFQLFFLLCRPFIQNPANVTSCFLPQDICTLLQLGSPSPPSQTYAQLPLFISNAVLAEIFPQILLI